MVENSKNCEVRGKTNGLKGMSFVGIERRGRETEKIKIRNGG